MSSNCTSGLSHPTFRPGHIPLSGFNSNTTAQLCFLGNNDAAMLQQSLHNPSDAPPSSVESLTYPHRDFRTNLPMNTRSLEAVRSQTRTRRHQEDRQQCQIRIDQISSTIRSGPGHAVIHLPQFGRPPPSCRLMFQRATPAASCGSDMRRYTI